MTNRKMCEICGEKPATVPDRRRMGRPINRICSSCHSLLLIGDFERILELSAKHANMTKCESRGDTDG